MENIFDEFKLYKQHNELLKKAEDIFPSSVLYNNFKDQLSIALKEGDLSQAEFALETFELMQQNENSPLFYDTLNQRLSDPLFYEFSDLIMDITPQFTQPEFVATPEINSQLAEAFGPEQTLISTAAEIEKQNIIAPISNKKVLNIVNGIITNNEVLYTPDGIITDRNQYTTNTLEEARQKAFEENIEQATTQQEINAVVDAFTPVSSTDTLSYVDDIAQSFEDSKEYASLDVSTVADEAKDITEAIIEENRRRATDNPDKQSIVINKVGAEAAEMGLE